MMRSLKFLPATLLAAALALPFAAAAQANVAITVDKASQQMTVAVDGATRYTWPVSTGRAGYDTPNGTFKPNRMDANHFSQEWDNAPMPHAMFFDNLGHAIHGFFDVKHLGLAVSHGCVRLSPANGATLFDLVKAEGMANTTITVTGRAPGGDNGPVARARLPMNEEVEASQPMQVAPGYGQQPPPGYDQPAPGYGQPPPGYGQPPPGYDRQSGYAPQPGTYERQPAPGYGQQFPPQPPPYDGRPAYGRDPNGQDSYAQRYYDQPNYDRPYYGQPYYGQPQNYGPPPYRQW